MEENPKCPKCGGENTVPICYGLPLYETYQKEQKGELVLGGCCVSDDSPSWYYKECKNSWGKVSEYRDGQRQELLKRFERHKEE
ncbi:MAG TPA: hypothetical protein PKO31_02315 [Methanofastidiosum sp.]|nr:hypothetical protein [Methanofastidiosum sp.]HQK62885.1 hypothetical protein [Methanofastidiosum sp.]